MIKRKAVTFPGEQHNIAMTEDVKDFITKCCVKTPSDRLGSGGSQQILEHPWFASLDIEAIKNKTNQDYKMNFSSKTNLTNFPKEFTSREATIPEVSATDLAKIE